MILETPKPQIVYAVSASECYPSRLSCRSISGLGAMFMSQTNFGSPTLTQEMVNYLNDRANELGISFQQAYSEEVAAREQLTRITPSYPELVAMAKRSPPPQEWYDE